MRPSCRVCGANQFKKFMQRNGFHLQRCRECALVQVTDDISNVSLEELYGKEFFDDTYMWLQEEGKGRTREYQKFHYRMQEIEKLYPEKGAILDVGCSFGFFLDVARSRGWEPVGVEIGEYAAKFAQTTLGLEVHIADIRTAPLTPRHFDVVTLWNVVEHLDDPVAEFERLNSVLKKGGLVVFTTGDLDSYVRRIQGPRWRAFIPPIHLAHYSVKAVKALLTRTGFSLRLKSVALPREALLQKLHIIGLLKKLNFSDKMMIFAQKETELS